MGPPDLCAGADNLQLGYFTPSLFKTYIAFLRDGCVLKTSPVLNLSGRWELIHVFAFLTTEGGGAFNGHMQPL